jgi:hypothetical protein
MFQDGVQRFADISNAQVERSAGDDHGWAQLQCATSSETPSMLLVGWSMRHILPRFVVLLLFQGKQAAVITTHVKTASSST